MSRLVWCLLLFGFAWRASGLNRTRRQCNDNNDNFTSCEMYVYDENGDLQTTIDLTASTSGTNSLWDNDIPDSFYRGEYWEDATNIVMIMNTSNPFYYLSMELFWVDLYNLFPVDVNQTFLRYRNVRNTADFGQWEYMNVTSYYEDKGSGNITRWGFNISDDDSMLGVLTDTIYINIVLEQQMESAVCDAYFGRECRLSQIRLFSNTIPTLAPTDMPSYSPSTDPTTQPSFNPSTIPSNNPTDFPSLSPTDKPSFDPTSIPSDFPSQPPSVAPTGSPSQPPTIQPTDGPTPLNFDDEIPFNFSQIETVGSLFVAGCVALAVFLVCVLFIMHRFRSKKGNSTVKFIGLIKYIQSIADVWSDLIFALVVYLQRKALDETFTNLYLFAFGFAAGPYLLSIVASIYWTCKWRRTTKDHPKRLNIFGEKFGCIMIMLTLLSNFYSVADLCHSKIFYSRFTNLPLKKNEYNVLKRWKLINIVLLENLPQLVIQGIYILSIEDRYRSIIVFFSMGMTVISLFLGIRYQLSCCDETKFVESRYSHAPKYKCFFVIESIDITMNHSYQNKKIEKAMGSVLKRVEDAEEIRKSERYAKHHLEVYWMNGRKGGMDVYFDCTVIYNAAKKGDEIAQKIFNHISNMMKDGTPNNDLFKDALGRKLNVKSAAKIKVSNFVCSNKKDIDEEFGEREANRQKVEAKRQASRQASRQVSRVPTGSQSGPGGNTKNLGNHRVDGPQPGGDGGAGRGPDATMPSTASGQTTVNMELVGRPPAAYQHQQPSEQ